MIFLIVKWGLLSLLILVASLLVFKHRQASGLWVLTYPKIGRPPYPCINKKEWTTPAQLIRTIDQLQKRGFTFISPRVADIPSKAILLVFLDGYHTFYREIYPLLKARQLPCTVCVPAEFIGKYNAWQNPQQEPWQDLLTLEELHQLAQDPLVTLGAQPLSRQDVTQLSPEQAQYEITEGIFRLEKILGKQPALFALWPAHGPLRLRELMPEQFRGWIWTHELGINQTPSSRLKTIWGNSWRARWLLWKMR